MTNTLYRLGTSVVTQEVAYRPARAAYYSTENFPARPGSAAGWAWVRMPVLAPGGGTVDGQFIERLVYVGPGPSLPAYSVTTYHPAEPEVPGSPATRSDTPPQGWTSFAHSIKGVRATGIATAKVNPGTVGAVLGFSTVFHPTPGYAHIPAGLLFKKGRVFQLTTGTLLDTFVATDTFAIQILPGSVTYKKNGGALGSEASPYGNQTYYLASALYGTGDLVDAPTITETNHAGANITLAPVDVFAGVGANKAGARITLAALTVSAGVQVGARITLPAIGVTASDHATGAGVAVELPAIGTSAYAGTLPVEGGTGVDVALTALAVSGLAPEPRTGGANIVLAPLGVTAGDHPNGAGVRVTLAPITLRAGVEPGDFAHMDMPIAASFGMTADAVDTAEMPMPMLMSIGMAAVLAWEAEMPMDMVFDIGMAAVVSQKAEMPMSMLFDVAMEAYGSDVEVWAVNTESGGSSQYTHYPFNSFALIGGRYYGARAGGIYELDGATDAGEPVRAAVDFGDKDFGTNQKKLLVECFVNVSADENLCMELRANGNSFVYDLDDFCTELQAQRFKFGKGRELEATYIRPVLYNNEGSDFELEAVSFEVQDLSRKL